MNEEKLLQLVEEHASLWCRLAESDTEKRGLELQLAEMTNTSNRIALQNAQLRERVKALEAWIEARGIGFVVSHEAEK